MELLNSARGKDLHDSFRARIKDLKAFHLVATFSSQGSQMTLSRLRNSAHKRFFHFLPGLRQVFRGSGYKTHLNLNKQVGDG